MSDELLLFAPTYKVNDPWLTTSTKYNEGNWQKKNSEKSGRRMGTAKLVISVRIERNEENHNNYFKSCVN